MESTGNYIADGIYDWDYMNPKETEEVFICELCLNECNELFTGYSIFCKKNANCCKECFETLDTW